MKAKYGNISKNNGSYKIIQRSEAEVTDKRISFHSFPLKCSDMSRNKLLPLQAFQHRLLSSRTDMSIRRLQQQNCVRLRLISAEILASLDRHYGSAPFHMSE
jgi:hypothetical protein